MALKYFQKGLKKYGVIRLLTERDLLLSAGVVIAIVLYRFGVCTWLSRACFSLYRHGFITFATQMAISLTAFILAGLAIIISFTNREFLIQLKELDIYTNILFVFQFNLYLTGLTALAGILASTIIRTEIAFLVFLFLFLYMIFSLTEMVDIVVEYGAQKARFENRK